MTTGRPDKAHVVADQSRVAAYLADPKTHGLTQEPSRIETHGAIVFLAGEHVYKMKRAVKFPFMDLSTLAKRKAACEAEVAVNRAAAPRTYIGVVPVTIGQNGPELGGAGEPIEWLVHMRRFDEQQTLDHVAERGELSASLLNKLVGAIVASHARAPVRPAQPAVDSLHSYIRQNAEAFRESPELFPSERAAALTRRCEVMLADVSDVLIERGGFRYVRRCHGDLHLGNIVLLDGEPVLFDAIEFDDAIATGDVLYDLAYLLMDLWERGLRREANLVLNRYLWRSAEEQIRGLSALPLFLALRAAIRAKVIAASMPHAAGHEREALAARAQCYFAAAERFLEPVAPRLIAIGGFSGSGKTTLAGGMAPLIGRPPGAVHLRSDIERKVLAGRGETERLPADAYTKAASDATYASLRHKAKLAICAGCAVIVDAVHARPDERRKVAQIAANAGVSFLGLWMDAPSAVLLERVSARVGDASEATAEIVRQQARKRTDVVDWFRLDATGGVDGVIANALRIVRK
jgi:hypothetical protein